MHPDCERILLDQETLANRVKELACQLDKLYEGRKPVVVCILKGSVMFYVDLIRNMTTPLELDFMSVSSYGSGTTSSGEIRIKKDLAANIEGRDVLIVEDIIDSGNTLYQLKRVLNLRNPKSVNIITLLDKPSRRQVPMEPDYKGFEIEDEFVIGYGLDYDENYRSLPYIGILKRSVYEK